MTTSASAPTPNSHPRVNPSEVGWQFVPQYYTFVNKEPHRLHCFYNKNSTFIHGTEGEDGSPCYGQQEIHKKITSIGFEDCKVFIHSVDAQSSANGGIIIQVIGEMSNKGEAWRKFVQTFFLAEQPNGYFVLNDIFRYLKEESVEEEATEPAEPEHPAPVAPVVEQPITPTPSLPEPVFEAPREPTPPPAPVAPAEPAPVEPEPVDEAPTNDVTEPVVTQTNTPPPEQAPPSPAVNGIHTPESEKVVPAPAAPAVVAEPPAQPAAPAPQPTPAAQPVAPAPAVAAPPQPPAPAPAPAAPTAPRSWASLAANNPRKWGGVATDARGTSEIVSTPSSGAQTPVTSTPAPSAQRLQQAPRSEHPLYAAAQNVATPHCFVKGVTEVVSDAALRSALARFGNIKELEIVRNKACAFLEYDRVDSAKRAIVGSLPHGQGGDGGVFIDVGGETGRVKINVETKKERSERTPTGRRGGAPPVNGDGAGRGGSGFRGGPRGGGGRGRGAPAAK